MADGSPMTVGKSDIEAVYPYMPAAGVDRQFAGVQPGAYCDPSMRQLRSRLIPFRYSTAALRFTRDAITGHLSIATGGPATFRLFGAGVGEDGSTMGMSGVAPDLALTETETDALEKGALVESGMLFRAVGFAITLGAPWVTGVATNMAPRQYPAWLEEYVPRLQRAVSDGGSFEFTHGQQACRYNLGRPSFYGSSSSVAEVQSSINIPGEFWFLAVEDVSSGNSDPSKPVSYTHLTLPTSDLV